MGGGAAVLRDPIYLDNAATTRASEGVVRVVEACLLENYGNPSSLHGLGVRAENIVKDASRVLAEAMGVSSEEIIFTSGGTESNNLAIFGSAMSRRREGSRVITTQVEHPSVYNAFVELGSMGFEPVFIPVDGNGVLDMDELRRSLTADTILVSVMCVNNEVGTVQPLAEVARAIRESPGKPLFHVDAVQSLFKVPFNPMEIGADLVSLSAHKIHGPKGCGALWIRRGVRLRPLLFGGGQQRALRSGTENVPGIAGFAQACKEALEDHDLPGRLALMRKRFIDGVLAEIPDSRVNGPAGGSDPSAAAPHIVNVGFAGVKGEVLVHMLEAKGIYVSTGSACSSRKSAASKVLESMKIPRAFLEGSIRVSFGRFTTMEEVDTAVAALKECVRELRSLRR